VQKSLQQWVEELTQQDLPVFTKTRQALDALANLPDVTGSQISLASLPDPMMVLKAMRIANSGRSQRFAQPILTIEHAVMMNGLSASFNKMLEVPVLQPDQCSEGLLRVLARSCHAASQARDWAQLRLDMNVEEVFIAASLQELGELSLWLFAPQQLSSLPELRRNLGGEVAERELLGFTLDELTLALAAKWNLPPLIASALNPDECKAHARVRLVSLAKKLAFDAEWGWHHAVVLDDIATVAEMLRISPDDAGARIHRVAADTARSRSFPGLRHAATWLPMLPGEWPDEAEQTVAITPDSPFDAAMAEIAAHFDGTLNLNELMKLVLKGMRDGIGLKRLVFALLNHDRTQLQARFVVGTQEDAPLRQFRFDMRSPTLFSKMIAKQQAFWLNDETRPKVQTLLEGDVKRITEASHFFAMTVAVQNKVIGMFYADREDQALSGDAYEQFKQLCTQASVGMAHLAKS